jgi:hypothetical protein
MGVSLALVLLAVSEARHRKEISFRVLEHMHCDAQSGELSSTEFPPA